MIEHHIGECRCARVRFRVEGPPLITMACHCTGCQRMTASAYSLNSLYARHAFAVIQGEPVIGGLREANRHLFCAFCMSWLYSHPAGMDEIVVVRSTLLDDARAYRPFVETCTSEMLPWAKTGAARSYAKFPPPEEFPVLLAEFARQRSAPATGQ